MEAHTDYPVPTAGPALQPRQPLPDTSRALLLNSQLPTPRFSGPLTASSAVSRAAETPTVIYEWRFDDIRSSIIKYFATEVTEEDKSECVCREFELSTIERLLGNTNCTAEEHIRFCISNCPVNYHDLATTSGVGHDAPTDKHANILTTAGQSTTLSGVVGISDYMFYDDDTGVVKGIMEAKCPWNITPRELDKVLNGSAASSNKAKLAVDQAYRYLCWNSQEIGIITTYLGWILLKREDGGILHLSRVMGFNESLQSEGYIVPRAFTAHHLLYWFTRLAQTTQLLRETRLVEAVELDNTELAIPTVDIRARTESVISHNSASVNEQGSTTTPAAASDIGAQNLTVVFHPWDQKNWLGHAVWKCNVRGTIYKNDAVIKVWNGYHDTSSCEREWSMYLLLFQLWDSCVPRLIAKGKISFMEVVILNHIEGATLSGENISPTVEDKIIKAYNAIHSQGVCHGDVKRENIIIGRSESVWIIDFEYGCDMRGASTGAKAFADEMQEVRNLLSKLRK